MIIYDDLKSDIVINFDYIYKLIDDIVPDLNVLDDNYKRQSLYYDFESRYLTTTNSNSCVLISDIEFGLKDTNESISKRIKENFDINLQDYFNQKIVSDKSIIDLILLSKYSYFMYSIEEFLEIDMLNVLTYTKVDSYEVYTYFLHISNYITKNFDPHIHNKSSYIKLLFLFSSLSKRSGYPLHSSIMTSDLLSSIQEDVKFYEYLFYIDKDFIATSHLEVDFDYFSKTTNFYDFIKLENIVFSCNKNIVNNNNIPILKSIYYTIALDLLNNSNLHFIRKNYEKSKLNLTLKKYKKERFIIYNDNN